MHECVDQILRLCLEVLEVKVDLYSTMWKQLALGLHALHT